MTTLIKEYVVKVDRASEDTITIGDKKLFLDTRFQEMQHITQEGVIVSLPSNPRFCLPNIEPGDTVYFHHFTCSEENDISEGGEKEFYKLSYTNIFARKRGEDLQSAGYHHSYGPHVLVDYIEESESDIKTKSGIFTKTVADRERREGIVRYSQNEDLIGLRVFFKANHDYELTVNGKRIYRMYEQSLLAAITEGGDYIPTPRNYVVKALEVEREIKIGNTSLIIPKVAVDNDGRVSKFTEGRIVRAGMGCQLHQGDRIMYRKGLDRRDEITVKDKKYFILNEDNIEIFLSE